MLKNHIKRPLTKRQGKQLNANLNKVGRNLKKLSSPKFPMKRINKPFNFKLRVLRAKVVSIGVEEKGAKACYT
jgi:hypothetical protein